MTQSANANPATNKPARPAPLANSLVAAPVNVGTAGPVELDMISGTLLVATALVGATTTTLVEVDVITLAVLVTVAFANGTNAAAALYASSVLLLPCCSLITIAMPF